MRKKGTQVIPSPTASVVVLVVLAGFLLFVLSIPEIDRQELLDSQHSEIDEEILFTRVDLDFSGYQAFKKNVLDFNDLTLDGAAKFEKSEIASDFDLTSSLFSTSNFEFVFSPDYDSDTIGHQVTFDVDSVNGYGKLRIYLNGEMIGSFQPKEEQTINIDLLPSLLVQGTNQLKINAKYVGLNPFNTLKVSLTNLAIMVKKQGNELEKSIIFYVEEDSQVSSAKVDFLVRNLGSTMSSPITVNINENEAFRITSDGGTSFSLLPSSIKSGVNKLSFIIDKGSAFELLFPKITIHTYREITDKNYQFTIDQTEARLVTDGRASCNLMLRSGDDADLDLVINGFSKSVHISEEVYEIDICDNLVYGTNRISMSSDNSFTLDEITIKLY